MTDDVRARLELWQRSLADALELDEVPVDLDAILGLAGVAAHSVVRPAAPLTTFLVGFAAGRAAANGTAPDVAVHEAVTTATQACRTLEAEP